MKWWIFLIPLLLVACAQADDTQNDAPTVDEPDLEQEQPAENGGTETGDTSGTAETGSTKSFTVEMYRYGFRPDPITVQQGDTVELTFTSVDTAHGASLPQFGVQTGSVPVGESETVTFVADQAGEFTYFCNTFCGSGHGGMTGTFIVE